MRNRTGALIGGAAITTAFIIGSLLGDMGYIEDAETARDWDLLATWSLAIWCLAALISFFEDGDD